MTRVKLLTAVFVCAALGGAFANWLHLPLAWMIGALIVSAGFALAGARFEIDKVRAYGLVVLGLSLGQSFTPQIVAQIGASLPLILGCGFLALLVGLPLMRLFMRYAGVDAGTAFFCSIPGGVVLMAVQAQRAEASEAHVVLAQTIRLAVVVLLYPLLLTFLLPDHVGRAIAAPIALHHAFVPVDLLWLALLLAAGVAVAHLARYSVLPNPWMIAPCLLAIALQQVGLDPVALPHWVITICQVILGVSLGARMVPDFLRRSGRLVVVAAISSLILTATLVALALAVSALSGLDRGVVLFGMSPGGMPEMTVAARSMGVAVPFVLSFHLTRILIANLVLEPLWHLLKRRVQT